jgi:hypothetical protein
MDGRVDISLSLDLLDFFDLTDFGCALIALDLRLNIPRLSL